MFTKYARGMVYWADIPRYENNPNVQSGMRPCIIVSNDIGNQFSKVVTVVPCTTNTDRNPEQVTHMILKLGRDEDSLVLCENIMTINKDLLKGFMGMLGEDLIDELNQALSATLGLVKVVEPKIKIIEKTKEEKSEEKKKMNRGRKVSGPTEMQKFLSYAKTHTRKEVMAEYGIPSEMAVTRRISYYRRKLKINYKMEAGR